MLYTGIFVQLQVFHSHRVGKAQRWVESSESHHEFRGNAAMSHVSPRMHSSFIRLLWNFLPQSQKECLSALFFSGLSKHQDRKLVKRCIFLLYPTIFYGKSGKVFLFASFYWTWWTSADSWPCQAEGYHVVVGPQVDATLVVAMAFAIDVPGRDKKRRGFGCLACLVPGLRWSFHTQKTQFMNKYIRFAHDILYIVHYCT